MTLKTTKRNAQTPYSSARNSPTPLAFFGFTEATLLLGITLLLATSGSGVAQPPPGYYDTVDTTDMATLRVTLHDIIKDHSRVGYDSGSPNTWDVLETADADPADPDDYILDIYKNERYLIVTSSRPYQREHSWPKAYGFPVLKEDAQGNTLPIGVHNYPYTDCHALFLAYGNYNSSRNTRPYAFCLPCDGPDCNCQPNQTVENYGRGGDTGMDYPGWANWRTLSPDSRFIWETWAGRRGDVARAQFYMDVRYEGGLNAANEWEPDLELISDLDTIKDSSNGSENQTHGYMGILSDLLVWHFQDPPDTIEGNRHEVVYGYQGNRNPFVDNPGWAYCLFLDWCSADLWVIKSDGVIEVVPGETLTYQIEAGSIHDMIGAVVSDTFDPVQFDVAAVSWTCEPVVGAKLGTYCPGSGTGSDLDNGVHVILEAGDSVLFTVTAPLKPTASGTLVNTASVEPPAGLSDPVLGDNSDTDTDEVLANGTCGAPDNWDVSGRIVDSTRTFTACTSITAGDFRVVGDAGDVTFRAGGRIVLDDGFQVEAGSAFKAVIDSAL